MPGVLMRFLEIARTFPNRGRDRDLTSWVRDRENLDRKSFHKRTGSYVCSANTFVNNSGMNFSTVYG